MAAALRAGLWLCCAAIAFLAFIWPFALGSDPSDPLFKPLAITVFCLFLATLCALATTRLRER